MTTEDPMLLQGENPQTRYAEDARRWHAAYRELIAYLDGLIVRTDAAAPQQSAGVPSELDELRARRKRWGERAAFWQSRMVELSGGIDFDARARLVARAGRLTRLTRRESELFAFLLAHPGRSYRSLELAERAWQAPDLPPQQVRNYMARLRRKLSPLRLPCELITEPGAGYRLKWAD